MLAVPVHRRRQSQHFFDRHTVDGDHVGHHRRPARKRACLVEREAAHGGEPLHVRAALDEHAAPGAGGQCRHHRHWRGDHERTRARDHEQHQRAIEPRARVAPSSQRRHDGDQRGKHHHGRRVDARESIDEGLRRRAFGLRGLDQMDDARQRRVAAQRRRDDLERAMPVDRSGEHLVAVPLVDRQRLARDRRLVDIAFAGHDAAVERQLLAGSHAHVVADPDFVGRHASLLPRSHDGGFRRRQVHQRADGVTRAVHASRFEVLREREEKDDACALHPFADRDGARHGHRHQHVHVEGAKAQRAPRAANRRSAAGDDGQQRRDLRDWRHARCVGGQAHGQRCAAGGQHPHDVGRSCCCREAPRARATRACLCRPRRRRWRRSTAARRRIARAAGRQRRRR